MKRYLIWLTAILTVVGLGFVALVLPASGTDGRPCVPRAAYDYEVNHPAVTHVVHLPEISHEETTIVKPEIWANFAPNDQQATFIGPPVWDVDSRGTWIVHNQLPPGQAGPDGVYSQGNPDKGGNWFYRQAEVSRTITVIDRQASDDIVIDREAWVEVVHVPAVVCPPPGDDPSEPPVTETPTPTPTPTETPSVTPTPPVSTPTPPVATETPVPPVVETPIPRDPPLPPITKSPQPEPPKDNPPNQPRHLNPPPQLIQCVDGVWVITQGDEVLSRSGTCVPDGTPPVEFAEQGM